eukprot:153466-Rhodomonas_salina.1
MQRGILRSVVKFPWPNSQEKVQFTTRQNGPLPGTRQAPLKAGQVHCGCLLAPAPGYPGVRALHVNPGRKSTRVPVPRVAVDTSKCTGVQS